MLLYHHSLYLKCNNFVMNVVYIVFIMWKSPLLLFYNTLHVIHLSLHSLIYIFSLFLFVSIFDCVAVCKNLIFLQNC